MPGKHWIFLSWLFWTFANVPEGLNGHSPQPLKSERWAWSRLNVSWFHERVWVQWDKMFIDNTACERGLVLTDRQWGAMDPSVHCEPVPPAQKATWGAWTLYCLYSTHRDEIIKSQWVWILMTTKKMHKVSENLMLTEVLSILMERNRGVDRKFCLLEINGWTISWKHLLLSMRNRGWC